jgi:hypothetical protein
MKYLTTNKQSEIGAAADENQTRKFMEKLKNKWRIREELGHIWVHGKHTEIVRKFLESKGF